MRAQNANGKNGNAWLMGGPAAQTRTERSDLGHDIVMAEMFGPSYNGRRCTRALSRAAVHFYVKRRLFSKYEFYMERGSALTYATMSEAGFGPSSITYRLTQCTSSPSWTVGALGSLNGTAKNASNNVPMVVAEI
ncbi:hypothetical protein DFJ73DRAFT_764888 [Zopfochytrium polystomum]|nr:hypothetical protein DFJ73DRAFT_764888 [Zopfochytrium polystomum]